MDVTDILVDDEQEILELAARILHEAGYSVLRAINADIGLLYFEQSMRFRLLITDVVLPGMHDGFALAHKAREFIPNIQLLYSTGFTGVARVRSFGSPYGDILRKPWTAESLVAAVARLIGPPGGKAGTAAA
jgi:CheY-like chemotaxis protein